MVYGVLQANTTYDGAQPVAGAVAGSGSSMNPFQSMIGGGLIGGSLGNALGGLLGMNSFQNPADAGMPFLQQIGPMLQKYLNPYIQNGNNAGSQLQGQYADLLKAQPQLQNTFSSMASNPGQYFNQMGQNFQQSPGYQFQVNQALGAADRAAAAGGMLGSPQEQANLAGTVNGLANQDYYNWANHAQNTLEQGLQGLQGLYGTGMSGLQNMYGVGAQSANSLAEGIAQALMSQANMQYAGTQNENENEQGGLGALIGGLGSGVGAIASFL
jgi:hypothetical protein